MTIEAIAFPQAAASGGPYDNMTLRDYFAGQVAAGMDQKLTDDFDKFWRSPEAIASRSYSIADAMIKQRKKS